MENTNRDPRRDDELAQHSAHDAAPHNDWRDDETNAWLTDQSINQNQEFISDAPSQYGSDDESIHAMAGIDAPDEDDDEEAGDWGNVDPAEGNSPFRDPMDPTSPGSAV